MNPKHLRIDFALDLSRAESQHDSECPEIGPICLLRNEPPQQHHTTLWITEARLLAEYGLLPNLAIQAVFPFRVIGTTTRYTDLAGTPIQLDYENIHHHNEILAGVGDAQLYFHRGWSALDLQFSARLGLNLPTGKVHQNPYVLGALGLPHEHLQFGTGTFDPLVGADLSKDFGRWSLAGFGQGQFPLYEGSEGYKAGARVVAGAVVTSHLGLPNTSFRLGLTAVHEAAERWNGQVPTDDGNQGRTDLFLGPGVTIPFANDWSVSFDVRGRVYGRAVNAQLNLPVLLEVSIGRLFHLEPGFSEPEGPGGAAGGDVQDWVAAGEARPLIGVNGKWTVFDFWATWCEACKSLEARLRALADSHPDIAIRRINVVDFDSAIAHQELKDVSILPHVRLLNPSGAKVFEGSGSPEQLLRQLEDQIRSRN